MNIAIIGTGYIAGRHAEALSQMKGINIVAHVDVRLELSEKAAQKWGGRAYDSTEEMLAKEKIDAAWLCVPPFAHGDIESILLKHNKAMYIEKPVGLDMDIPSRLLQAIAAQDTVVNVGYYWRCLEIIPKIQEMLRETPAQMVRIAYHGPTAPAKWWSKKSMSGGQIVEQVTHLVDIARYLVGDFIPIDVIRQKYVRKNFPDLDIDTTTAALVKFDNGIIGTLSATCLLNSFVDTAIEFLCENRKITLSLREIKIDDETGSRVESTGRDPLVIADEQFVEAVRKSDKSLVPCSYSEALKTQEACVAIQNWSSK